MQEGWCRDLSKAFSAVIETATSEEDAKRIGREALTPHWNPWPTQLLALQASQAQFPNISFPPCPNEQAYLDDAYVELLAAAVYNQANPVESLFQNFCQGNIDQVQIEQATEQQVDEALMRMVLTVSGANKAQSKIDCIKTLMSFLKTKTKSIQTDTTKRKKAKQKRDDRQEEEEKDEEQEEEDEEANAAVASLLTKMRDACIPNVAAVAQAPIPETLASHSASLLQESTDMQKLLSRGAYIDLHHVQLGESWERVAHDLSITAKKPKSAARIVQPHSLFKLVVNDGLYKLRFLRDDSVSVSTIRTHYKAISEHFQQHPEELAWWQEGQAAPIPKSLPKEDGTLVQSVDKNWLTGKQ